MKSFIKCFMSYQNFGNFTIVLNVTCITVEQFILNAVILPLLNAVDYQKQKGFSTLSAILLVATVNNLKLLSLSLDLLPVTH